MPLTPQQIKDKILAKNKDAIDCLCHKIDEELVAQERPYLTIDITDYSQIVIETICDLYSKAGWECKRNTQMDGNCSSYKLTFSPAMPLPTAYSERPRPEFS